MLDLLLPWLPGYGAGSAGAAVTPTLPTEDPVPLFGWPIYSDRSVSYVPTFSGGSWRATLPLAHLADRRLARVARSSDATTGSTQFTVDLKTTRAVGVLALPKHRLSQAAKVRWKAADSEGGLASPTYDSGLLDAWPALASAEDVDGLNVSHVHVPADVVSARFWRCEITDAGNAAGYVDLSRVVIAGAWYPSTGIATNAKLGLETSTERVLSDGGAAMYRPKPVRRVWDFTVPMLEEMESFATVWRMIRQLGAHGQLFFVFDKNDPFMHERSFLCVMRELSAIEYPYADSQAVPFRLIEEL